jgi:hypothetical protein
VLSNYVDENGFAKLMMFSKKFKIGSSVSKNKPVIGVVVVPHGEDVIEFS